MIVEPPASASPRRTGSLAVLGAGEAASPALVTAETPSRILFDELAPVGLHVRDPQRPAAPRLPRVAGRGRGTPMRVIVVSRPDQLHPSDAVELRNQLDLVDTPVLGHVVVGRSS